MPFLPFVLLLAWQAISKSASFALGWATALYFGQVPGRQGRILSVVSLLAAGWNIVLVGFALPLLVGAALDAAGIISRNFSVMPLHVAGLAAGIVLAPPASAALTVWADFHDHRSWGTWLRLIPASYPAMASLGVGVLLMVVLTPFLAFQRLRRKQRMLQVPLMMRDESSDDDLVEAVRRALRSLDIERVEVVEADGPLAWPLHAVGFAARHLLGAAVRGDPMRISANGLNLIVFATAVSIIGPDEQAYRARAAVERELAFANVFLTWSDDSRDFEVELMRAHANGGGQGLRRRLDEIQGRIDAASLDAEEWNILYRMRLQAELDRLGNRGEVSGRRSGSRSRQPG